MAEPFASGDWHVTAGKEDEFIERWTEFLNWTRETQPGLLSANLLRDSDDPSHFVSFAEWRSPEGRASWRESEGFMARFTACRELCDGVRGADYGQVVSI